MTTDAERRAWQERGYVVGRDARREPLLTAEVQTRLSWARRISAFDELPVPFHAAVRAVLGDAELPYAILTPAFPGPQRRCNEHLVLSCDDRIHVFERTASGVTTTTYPIAGLHAAEFGEVLLDGWITLRGATADGSVASSTLRFNSATSDLLDPFEILVRPRPDSAGVEEPAEQAKGLAWLRQRDFKFHELARSAVGPGDRVIDLVFQPLIAAPVPGLPGGMSRRTIELAHLLLLTATELILIADSPNAPEARGDGRHGAVRTHVSLDRVVGARLSTRPDGRLTFMVDLPADYRLEAVFDPDARGDVDRFLGNLVATAPRVGRA